MLKLLIEKELREIIGSAKFAVTFGVCSFLIVLTFYVGAKSYQLNFERYQAAKTENKRQMQGLTDWINVRDHKIFLPPQPLESLIAGVSNDIGRTVAVAGRGELMASDSRFNDDPIFAIFRFLDLDFIFQIVLSLFAILLAYDAVNGEKERGTLRLSFANPVPRATYILGKLLGMLLSLIIPLLIPVMLGCLIYSFMGVYLTGDDWVRLALVLLTGFLFLGVFLMLAVLCSVVTTRSANSFLLMLVIWIFAVLVIPRSAVLLAGRAVDVPTIDELDSQKNQLSRQLWREDRKKMSTFKPKATAPEQMGSEFMAFMEGLSEGRDTKIMELTDRLNENRQNRQKVQEGLALSIAKISPAASFSLAATTLAGTSLDIKNHFISKARGYQTTYGEFMKTKTGQNQGGGMRMIRVSSEGAEAAEEIDPNEIPLFDYKIPELKSSINAAMFDMGLLTFLNLVFFAGAFVRFLKFDVR